MAANPEAIAWYLKRSESLLDDLRARVLSLRARGGQITAFSGAVLALAGANVDSVLGVLHGVVRAFAGSSMLVGLLLLITSVVTVLRGTVLPGLSPVASAEEVSNYVTERFTDEPDLWRVHLRTILGLRDAIEAATGQEDVAARAVRKAEYFFLSGLCSVGITFVMLVVGVTF